MIRFLKHIDIDKTRWDECVKKSANGNVYALSHYLDIVHPQWEALVSDDYEAVMPLPSKSKFRISYLFTPFFVQQLGIFSPKELNINDINKFIENIPDKFKAISLRLNEGNLFDGLKNTVNHRNIILPLSDDASTLRENYHNNLKRNIKQAENNNVELIYDIDTEVIINLFRENRGKSVTHWGDAEYAVVKRLPFAFVIGAKVGENVEAGACFLEFGSRITFIFSGCSEVGKNMHLLALILDAVVEKYAGTGKVLDFEGSDDDGLARFYLGFGGRAVLYPELKANRGRFITKILINKKLNTK